MIRKYRAAFKVLFMGVVAAKIIVAVFCLVEFPAFPVRESVAAEKKTEDQKAAPVAALPERQAPEGQKAAQFSELQSLMNQLDLRETKVKEEEGRIRTERAQLDQLKQEIDVKLDELSAVQKQIDEGLTKKDQMTAQEQQTKGAADVAKAKQLAKVYISMAPKKAAQIIEKMDLDIVYQVFSNMKGEEVGQIMTYVNGDKAAQIMEHMAGKGEKKVAP